MDIHNQYKTILIFAYQEIQGFIKVFISKILRNILNARSLIVIQENIFMNQKNLMLLNLYFKRTFEILAANIKMKFVTIQAFSLLQFQFNFNLSVRKILSIDILILKVQLATKKNVFANYLLDLLEHINFIRIQCQRNVYFFRNSIVTLFRQRYLNFFLQFKIHLKYIGLIKLIFLEKNLFIDTSKEIYILRSYFYQIQVPLKYFLRNFIITYDAYFLL